MNCSTCKYFDSSHVSDSHPYGECKNPKTIWQYDQLHSGGNVENPGIEVDGTEIEGVRMHKDFGCINFEEETDSIDFEDIDLRTSEFSDEIDEMWNQSEK